MSNFYMARRFLLLLFFIPAFTQAQYIVHFDGTGETKPSYAAANVTLTSINWTLDDALIGTSTSDRFNGTRSARVRNVGTMTMLADKPDGLGSLSIKHALYGSDGTCTWKVEYSTDGGVTWQAIGSVITTSSTSLVTEAFQNLNITGNVRIKISKLSGGTNRINFDDITLSDNGTGGGDVIAPAVSTLFPANNSVDVVTSTMPAITFTENVEKGTGNIVVHNSTDNTDETIAVSSTAVTITGAIATINATLQTNKSYYILLDANSFRDVAGNNFAGIASSTIWTFTTSSTPPPAVPHVVINQFYGGGGNSGATYKNDFIVLYNNENIAVSVDGWSVQYTAAASSSWQVTTLSGNIPAHGYYLIQQAAGSAGTTNLPTPDATGGLLLGATNGKVILCNTTTAQTGENPAGSQIIDKLGFGTATGFEGHVADAASNTLALHRITDGTDTDNNKNDFALAEPDPRNSSYTTAAPTVVTFTPPTATTDITYNIVPSLTFDKGVVKGTGNIVVHNVTDGTNETLDVTASHIAVTGKKVSIPATLASGKSYYITIPAGAFKDAYGNSYAGITSTTDWAFAMYNTAVPQTVPVSFTFNNCTGSGLLPQGFTQFSVTGLQVWDCTIYGRDPANATATDPFPNAVQMNGYANGTNIVNEDWLISPAIDLNGTTYPLLSFWSRTNYNGDPLQLKISTNYTGTGDPRTASWRDLNGKFPAQASNTWTLSSDINLAAFNSGTVYIAFVYNATNDDGALWTLDDISISNSQTPPAPSITISTSDVQFGYISAGNISSAKTFTIIGNDITSDVTVTASGGFQISIDGTSFNSTATISQATANNTAQTIYVQFVPSANDQNYMGTIGTATSALTAAVAVKGTSIDVAKTLEIVNWNIEWFGSTDPTLGPTNDNLQEQNIKTIMQNVGADLYALLEVVDETRLQNIVSQLPGYSYVINNYGSHTNSSEPSNTRLPLDGSQKIAFVYKTSVFSNVTTTALLSKGINSAEDLNNPAYNNWSSGRFPFMMTAAVTLDGITKTIRFIAVHAKANTSPTTTSYNRRKAGADELHDSLNIKYSGDNIILLGDFNDDLDKSITAGFTTTSYSAFTTDAGNYSLPTLALSNAGKKSTVKYSDMIDHVVVSNELQPYYMNASASVLSDVSSLVSSYGTTTTDHYPVFTRFAFSAAILPVQLTNFNAVKAKNMIQVLWQTAQESNSQAFEIERSADGNSFTQIGKVAASGNTSTATLYSFDDRAPLSGSNYYRLKQVDKDSQYKYSKVVKVDFSEDLQFHFTPNPAQGHVTVHFGNAGNNPVLQLVDLNGKTVRQKNISNNSGITRLDIGGLPKGIYLVRVAGSKATATGKLVVK